VPVDRPDADPGPAGDVVHLRLATVLGEHGPRRGEHLLAVAARVGSEGPLLGDGDL
jgi:hypothetical protein